MTRQSPKVHRDVPTGPEPWLDSDPLTVAPEPLSARGPAVQALLLRVAVVVSVLVILALYAASRSSAVIPSPGPAWGFGESDQRTSGAPHRGSWGDGPRVSSVSVRRVGERPARGAPSPSGGASTRIAGWATWCAPTPDRCQSWGPPALLGAVSTFTYGDEPYTVTVWRGERHVEVLVVSYCGCGIRDGKRTVIDLSPAAMAELEPDYVAIGVVLVEVEGLRPGSQLPATDTPDQHPQDPPEHPDDARMRQEDGGPALPPTDIEGSVRL